MPVTKTKQKTSWCISALKHHLYCNIETHTEICTQLDMLIVLLSKRLMLNTYIHMILP